MEQRAGAEPVGTDLWSIAEVARMSAVTTRTLRHYDAIGLITPTRTGTGGRRSYDHTQLLRLQQVLLLRQLGVGLGAIADVVSGGRDPVAALLDHRTSVHHERSRLDRVATTISRTIAQLRGERAMTAPELFDGLAYVHGYHPAETSRLHDQADTLLDLIHDGTTYPPGARVLEVGCGVGAQTVALATRNPGIDLTSVDISADSVAQAQRRVAAAGLTGVTVRQGDLFDLTSPAATYDHAFVCFVLEHLDRPVEALTAISHHVRPGGSITVVEGDHGTVCFHPEDPDARAAIDCQVQLQTRAGGNAMIGRQLHPLLTAAGLADVTVQPRLIYADANRPDLVDGFTRRTFTAMVAGIRTDAIDAGLTTADEFDAGIRALERTTEPDGTFSYTFSKATATTPT